MKLQSIEIQGYKSISYDQPLHLELGDVSILLGANGAGKSNIISFFKMLGYMMSSAFGIYVEKEGTSNAMLHYGSKCTPAIAGKLTFADNRATDEYKFMLTNAAPDRLVITEESIEWWKKEQEKPYTVTLDPNFKESALVGCKDKVAKFIYRMLSSCKVYQFHDSSSDGPLRKACPVETADYLQSQGNNLPSFLYYLKTNHSESYRRIVDYVREVVPQFQDFYLEPSAGYISLRWIDNSATDYRLNAHQFSDGTIRFIALATLLLQPKATMPKVIIIDEPELGLHPYAITQLAEMIRDASLNAQIIVSTQSKDLVDHFDVDDVTIVEMDESQRTTAKKLNASDLHLWLEQYTISELWDKNLIGGRPV